MFHHNNTEFRADQTHTGLLLLQKLITIHLHTKKKNYECLREILNRNNALNGENWFKLKIKTKSFPNCVETKRNQINKCLSSV